MAGLEANISITDIEPFTTYLLDMETAVNAVDELLTDYLVPSVTKTVLEEVLKVQSDFKLKLEERGE